MVPVAFGPIFILLLVVVIPLLVMFIKLCIKKPKIAAIVALILIVFVVSIVLRMHVGVPLYRTVSNVTHQQARPVLEASQYLGESSPIWSEGIEDQFVADIYPSRVSAVQSVSRRIGEQFRHVMIDSQQPDSIVVLQNSQNFMFVELLRDSILKQYPEIKCRIDDSVLPSEQHEVGILLDLTETNTIHLPLGDSIERGKLRVTTSNQGRKTRITINFVEKPWVEDFSSFTNSQPDKQFIVAKSSESCLAPGEAEKQAMEDACSQVGTALLSIQNPNKIDSQNILESGMIIDKFVQSFDGTAGKIWRQAILLDVSPEKLNRLADKIAGITRVRRERRLSTVGSIAGLFVLITIVYIFLNAATKGYYTWSLRIVGVVLALILIFLLFT